MKQKIIDNYGWVVCAACTLLLFCNSGLSITGFTVYQPYLINVGGLTNTESSSVLMFRTFFSIVGMFVARRLIRRFEIRRVVTTSCFVLAVAFVCFAFADGFLSYSLAAGIAGLVHGCGGMIPASIVIARWFNEHRGLALGICMGATGFSSIVGSPIITWLVESTSLRTAFLIEAAFVAVCAVIVYLLLYSNPSCLHTHPVGKTGEEGAPLTHAMHDPRRRLYFIMLFGVFLFGATANLINTHVSVLYRTEGFDPGQVATILAIVGGVMTIGKMSYGGIADKIGLVKSGMLFYALFLAGTVVCTFAGNGSFPLAILGSVILGAGLAVTSVSNSMYASLISTEAAYAKTMTRFQTANALGGLVFGFLPGLMADRSGSYIPFFVVMIFVEIAASSVLLMTYRKIRVEDVSTLMEPEHPFS